MRVIRRNLVYAVGLPPNIANEDQLRKGDYFSQYGKIAKIVLNRNQITSSGDSRRGTASAYVTFVHKDTLACILALDGFYMDGRNIRASYGTSKYCSAFIKNVRCNNPDCTYLHSMGDIEDTFTKQEIQAGYVTSGRDVEARQQQIVQQALSAQSGAAGSAPRRRTGGGGPSGSGKASSNPVFPPPSFDEPARASTANLVPAPPASLSGQPRSVSAAAPTSGFPSISVANAAAAVPTPATVNRASTTSAIPVSAASNRASVAQKVSATSRKSFAGSAAAAPAATAASVVAGVHSINGTTDMPAPHTTLTPLTPLKRTTGKGSTKPTTAAAPAPNPADAPKLPNMRTGAPKNKVNGLKNGMQSIASNGSDSGSVSGKNAVPSRVESTIGGDVIPVPIAAPMGGAIAPMNGISHAQASGHSALSGLGGDGLLGLGGEVFDGPLQSNNGRSAIGGGKDKWNVTPGPDTGYPLNQSSMWGNGGLGGQQPQGFAPGAQNTVVRGGVIGGATIGGMPGSGSSALASMLGINLPTGSGSLHESTNLWSGSAPGPQPPIAALNGNSMPIPGVIGGNGGNPNNGLIGGVAIGGNNRPSDTFGGGGNKSDIALLQSLLPGVHITSGGVGNPTGEWSSAPGTQQPPRGGSVPLTGDPRQQQGVNLQSSLGGQHIGQNQRAPGSIW
ncbi:MAG: hypothetical protein SGILL_001294 [Bacillariaceae sp.]